jgi:hypothetical protein
MGTNGSFASRPAVKVLLLGQCLQYGYDGVSSEATFPRVAAGILRREFPAIDFRFDFKHLYHPIGLKAILHHRLRVTKPDIALINLAAMFAARPWRVNAIYELAPELVDTARAFARRIEAAIRRESVLSRPAETKIDKIFTWHPPLALDEYERLVRDAVEFAKQISPCRLVLIGPGSFNEDTIEQYPIHNPQLWSTVNEMIGRVARTTGAEFLNVQGVLSQHGGEVFIRANHRFSILGHEHVARELSSSIGALIPQILTTKTNSQ